MGGKGGSKNTTTMVQQSDPWKGQQPYLTGNPNFGGLGLFNQTAKLYQEGKLAPSYYPGITVAPQDAYTTQAIKAQAQRALSGSPSVKSAQSQLDQTMKGQYLNNNPFSNPDTSPSFLTQYAKESTSPSFLTQYKADSGTPDVLTSWQSGPGNPALDAMVKRAQGQTLASVNGNFAQAGRYGSGAHAAAANDAAGNIATEMYGQAYDQDQNRSLQAWDADQAKRLEAYEQSQNRGLQGWQAGQQNQLSAYTDAQNRNLQGWQAGQQNQLSAWDSALNRELSAYNTERENQMRGMMFAPSLAEQDYKDIAALSEAGTAKENYLQQQINATIDKHNFTVSRPLTGIQNYAALIQGNYGGTSSTATTAVAGRSNPLGSALGGALTGGGLASTLGLSNPWVAAAAGLGGLLGLF